MNNSIKLFRPVGRDELVLIIDSDMKRFPPRLYWQPIFYPVMNLQYACEIAERWNMADPDSDDAGFVTEFEMPSEYIAQFPIQTVGMPHHRELWIPSDRLEEFNDQIQNGICVVKTFIGSRFVMPDKIKRAIREE